MTLPLSGPISLNQVNVELGLSGTTVISLNQTNVRTLAEKPSGTISMSDLYGKPSRITITINVNSDILGTYAININALSGYVAGKTDVIFNVANGIYIFGSNALFVTSGAVGDTFTLNNNGYLLGYGGNGGNAGSSGSQGRTAVLFQFSPVSLIVNNAAGAYICGGGGGGAGGSSGSGGGGGGAGGGSGGSVGVNAGGIGGNIRFSGSNGATSATGHGGGGGGCILPGTRTTPTTPQGIGGSAGGSGGGTAAGNVGGYGGAPTEAGQTVDADISGNLGGGGGGGYGAAGGSVRTFSGVLLRSGGTGGNAITKPTGTFTLNNAGNIYGAIA